MFIAPMQYCEQQETSCSPVVVVIYLANSVNGRKSLENIGPIHYKDVASVLK